MGIGKKKLVSTFYKVSSVGKTGFASHTKHVAKTTKGSTSFMRDNI